MLRRRRKITDRARQFIGESAREVGVRSTLWCSAFLRKITGAQDVDNRALSWEKHQRIAPQVGAVVTMGRRGGGHVGVVSGFTAKGDPIVISGNHGNRARRRSIPAAASAPGSPRPKEPAVLKFTTEMLRNGLLRRHKPGAVARQELRIGCGYAGGADRSIDLWVIEAAATKGCPATSYKIKVSRADFQKDMKQPLKQRGAPTMRTRAARSLRSRHGSAVSGCGTWTTRRTSAAISLSAPWSMPRTTWT